MSELFNIFIQSNTINFLIVLFIVIFLFAKLNIKQKIEALRDEIKAYVESSENEKKQAQKDLTLIEEKIEKLPNKIEIIKQSTLRSIKNYEKNINASTEEMKHDIEKNADRLFKLETKKFKEKLTNMLSLKSIEVAKENAIAQLENNRDLHNHYIDNAISELDGINL